MRIVVTASSKDKRAAAELVEALRAQGNEVLLVEADQEDESFLKDQIETADAVVAVAGSAGADLNLEKSDRLAQELNVPRIALTISPERSTSDSSAVICADLETAIGVVQNFADAVKDEAALVSNEMTIGPTPADSAESELRRPDAGFLNRPVRCLSPQADAELWAAIRTPRAVSVTTKVSVPALPTGIPIQTAPDTDSLLDDPLLRSLLILLAGALISAVYSAYYFRDALLEWISRLPIFLNASAPFGFRSSSMRTRNVLATVYGRPRARIHAGERIDLNFILQVNQFAAKVEAIQKQIDPRATLAGANLLLAELPVNAILEVELQSLEFNNRRGLNLVTETGRQSIQWIRCSLANHSLCMRPRTQCR